MPERRSNLLGWLSTVAILGALAGTQARSTFAQTSAPRSPARLRSLPIDVEYRGTPWPVRGDDGRYHIAYNLIITNWGLQDFRFSEIQVLDSATGKVLLRLDSAMLEDPLRLRTTLAVNAKPMPENLILKSGVAALVAVEFSQPGLSATRQVLRHSIRFRPDSGVVMVLSGGSTTSELQTFARNIAVHSRPPIVLSPPVRGGLWRCGNGLSYNRAHASPYMFEDARLRVPQRYGCDFARVDSGGNTLPNPFPDTINSEMFYGYGAQVLAVADGIITHLTDSIPENIPQADGSIRMPVPFTNKTVSGNWVSLRIGQNAYAFYAHLQPGSVRVRLGQRVKRGQVLGLLGTSGNAVGPHLHFHVGDSNSLNGSESVPFVFDTFTFVGRGYPLPGQGTRRRMELPLADAIIRFDTP